MTVHPIDRARARFEDYIEEGMGYEPSRGEAMAVLDALAAAEHERDQAVGTALTAQQALDQMEHRATRAEAELDKLQAAHRDATSHARLIIAHPDRWISEELRGTTSNLLSALTGAPTVRGGASHWRRKAVTAEGRAGRAEEKLRAVRDVLDKGSWTGNSSGNEWVAADIRRALDA